MSKLLKITTMLMITSFSQLTFAGYQVALPLEMDAGGALPNGSINIGDKTNPDTNQPPSSNCIYNNENRVIVVSQNMPDENFAAGDMIFAADQTVISYYSPSNNKYPKPGLSKGKQMDSDAMATYFEICANDLSIYPPMPPVNEEEEEEGPPTDDHTGPDWTPECILNTSSDYAAINTSNGAREFHSTTFGLTNFASPRWYYVPDNYDPDATPVSPSSYIYFDKSEKTGDPRISGPNPNYTYSEICRVKNMEL